VEGTLADFRQHYELLSDEALLEVDPDDLVDAARQCFEEEVARRGLNAVAGDSTGEVQAASASGVDEKAGEEEVLIATFISGDELNLARGLLQSASIPSRVENPLALMSGMELRLIVPAAFEEQALEILAAEISEEELAAQAEAAGAYDEPEEDSEDPGV
jgi:mannose/fructose-specific phosphotransferase system component IIA